MKAFGENRPEYARQEDVEQIEERADSSRRNEDAMRSRDGQAVEARPNGSLIRHDVKCFRNSRSDPGSAFAGVRPYIRVCTLTTHSMRRSAIALIIVGAVAVP